MIDAAKIAEALKSQLTSNVYMVQNGVKINRGEYVNMDPDLTPWVSIYRDSIDYVPERMGKHTKSFTASIVFKLLIQESNLDTGEKCEDQLEALTQAVLDAVWADPKLGGNVDMLTAIDVNYSYNEHDSKTIYFQWSIVSLTFKVATG